jgi:hypothetical protein
MRHVFRSMTQKPSNRCQECNRRSSPWLKKARQVCTNVKSKPVMFIAPDVAAAVLESQNCVLRICSRTKCIPTLIRWHLWYLQENVRLKSLQNGIQDFVFPVWHCCSLCIVHEFLPTNRMTNIPYPLYVADSVLCDFFLFPQLRKTLKGRKFNDISMIHIKLWDIVAPFQTVHVMKCLEQWCCCLAHHIKCPGDSTDSKVKVVEKFLQSWNYLIIPSVNFFV